MIRLSILIPTIRGRLTTCLPSLLDELDRQARGLPVEVLALYDNASMSVGEKRNRLVRAASGMYLMFADDDDWPEPDYVPTVLERTHEKPDVIVFDVECTIDGGAPRRCVYGVELRPDGDSEIWVGRPTHTHAWAEWIPRRHAFPDRNVGEDRAWSREASRDARVQSRIPRVLYHYRYSSTGSATRNRADSDGEV